MNPPEAHWAAVSRATRAEACWQARVARERRRARQGRLRMRLGLALVRAGLKLARPLTVTRIVPPS